MNLEQPSLPGRAPVLQSQPRFARTEPEPGVTRLRQALDTGNPSAQAIAAEELRVTPANPELLLLAALAALVAGDPAHADACLRRYTKRYVPGKAHALLVGLSAAVAGHRNRARALLKTEGLLSFPAAARWFVGDRAMLAWLDAQLSPLARAPQGSPRPRLSARPPTAPRTAPPPPPVAATLPDLPRLSVPFAVTCEFVNADEIRSAAGPSDPTWFALRAELNRLGLVEGFDELLCLATLNNVAMHRFQIDTVRKVLRQYRGRVLLADEVGLGKTIEAGMVLKEYALRGMAERMLILAPPSLVGQWRDELAEKFAITCATTQDSAFRSDPSGFWDQPRIIASIAAARRSEHAALLSARAFDIVVVDEAHHLRDQSSASYRLVSRLQKRFLLLLSATPVQNNLIELYHLLTLLKPGIFKTAREFRAAYMLRGSPREPVNRDRLRDLMRGVMVRNTRALAALNLPRRHAATERAEPSPDEATCYAELAELVRARAAGGADRLSLGHLLSAAGSSPAAAATALAAAAGNHPDEPRFATLAARYSAIPIGAKDAALLRLIARNPAEKKIVFLHHRPTMNHLATLLAARGTPAALFHGSLSGAEKDAAVEAFQNRVPVLLAGGSGGEGRNLQFCNTLINFDIPWNPMAIEQRIGRIDRIGQTREVFIFNLVAAHTIEDEMLRILDEKINMFELVVGEAGAILGELDEKAEFSSLVLEAWLAGTEAARSAALADLGEQLSTARHTYQEALRLDEMLFGSELDAA
ncbi:MAG: DEAD/DEAH box helicase [Acetobacteraceae bacterium]